MPKNIANRKLKLWISLISEYAFGKTDECQETKNDVTVDERISPRPVNGPDKNTCLCEIDLAQIYAPSK